MDRIFEAQSKQNQTKIETVPQFMTKLMMKLMVSKDRQGRFEFISAWTEKDVEEIQDRIKEFIGM